MTRIKKLCGVMLAVAMVWMFFYNFHIFPWIEGDMKWWNIPEMITVLYVCISGMVQANKLIDL